MYVSERPKLLKKSLHRSNSFAVKSVTVDIQIKYLNIFKLLQDIQYNFSLIKRFYVCRNCNSFNEIYNLFRVRIINKMKL